MYVFDQSGSIDSAKLIEYITKDFPGEFKQLIEARDELAKRQGALSAVDKALKDRAKAEQTLAAAEKQANDMLATAAAKLQDAAVQLADLEAKQTAFDKSQKEFAAAVKAKESDFNDREVQLIAREQSLANAQEVCNDKLAAVEADRISLNARIKAFQDKVAALSA